MDDIAIQLSPLFKMLATPGRAPVMPDARRVDPVTSETQIVLADETQHYRRHGRHCCRYCSARVHRKPPVQTQQGGNRPGRAAHFATNKGHNHDRNCPYGVMLRRRAEKTSDGAAPVLGYIFNINVARLDHFAAKQPFHSPQHEPVSIRSMADLIPYLQNPDFAKLVNSRLQYGRYCPEFLDSVLVSTPETQNYPFARAFQRLSNGNYTQMPAIMQIDVERHLHPKGRRVNHKICGQTIIVGTDGRGIEQDVQATLYVPDKFLAAYFNDGSRHYTLGMLGLRRNTYKPAPDRIKHELCMTIHRHEQFMPMNKVREPFVT